MQALRDMNKTVADECSKHLDKLDKIHIKVNLSTVMSLPMSNMYI